MSAGGWDAVLTTVLFPLVADLAGPAEPDLMHRAFAFCTRTFLQYVPPRCVRRWRLTCGARRALQALMDGAAAPHVWRHMLACVATCLRTVRGDVAREAVSEGLKNMLLVLAASQALPADAWAETWAAVEALQPGLRAEIGASRTELRRTYPYS
jgi:hypothetical protein